MRFHHPGSFRSILLGLALVSFLAPLASAEPGQVVAGNARFTVITPECVRLEYSPQGKFIDEPSYFAASRGKPDASAEITTGADQSVIVDTAALHLTYRANGKPFDAQNLQITVRNGTNSVQWKPGEEAASSSANLGGTATTLDRYDGARALPDGVLSRQGWYLLDDSRTPLLTTDWVKERPADSGIDWYFFGYGGDYKSALRSLTAVSGAVPLPRRYLMGDWYSRYWNYTSDQFKQIVQEYAEHGFPLDVIVMDIDWHLTDVPGVPRHSNLVWTGYTWNKQLIPDPKALLKWFHENGVRVTLNDHPSDGVWQHEEYYADFMRAMGKDPAANEHLLFDAGDKTYMDNYWRFMHATREVEGVDFWWLDWQQYPMTLSIPTLRNLAWLNEFYFRKSMHDDLRGASFSRWAGWGDQRHPIHFSGDASTSFNMLAYEVPFTSTAGNVGCFFWSHDIGGHMRGRNEESYTRWCQFGAFTAALRSHSTRDATMDRRPWTYPSWAEDSMRISFQLRSKFFPYTYSAAQQTCENSIPLVRPMYLEFPNEEAAYHQPQQYLYGDNILVAPVTEPGAGAKRIGRQVVWFPPGRTWFNFFTGERFNGGNESLVAADINEFPLYIAGGVPISMRSVTQHMATDPLRELVIRCYPGAEGQSASSTLYEDDGVTMAYAKGESARTKLTYARQGDQVTLSISPAEGSFEGMVTERSYVIELPCMNSVRSVLINGLVARAEYDDSQNLIRVKVPAQSVRQPCAVVVNATQTPAEQIRLQAFARRAGLQTVPTGATIKSLLATALGQTSNPTEAAALAAAAGTGIYFKNENVYGFPATTPTRHTYATAEIEARVTAPPSTQPWLDLPSPAAPATQPSADSNRPPTTQPFKLELDGHAYDLTSW